MPSKPGRNLNEFDLVTTKVTVSGANAVLGIAADLTEMRRFLEFSITPGDKADACILIRPIPVTTTPTLAVGIPLFRYNMGNDTMFRHTFTLADAQMDYAEFSLILDPGSVSTSVDVFVTVG